MYGVDHYDVCAAITSGSALILQQLQHLSGAALHNLASASVHLEDCTAMQSGIAWRYPQYLLRLLQGSIILLHTS